MYNKIEKFHESSLFNRIVNGDYKYVPDNNELLHIRNDTIKGLPNLFIDILNNVPQESSKGTVLFSILNLISGALPNVKGYYGGQYVESNLYGFVYGNYGTGKGVMLQPKTLLNGIQHNFDLQFKVKMEAFPTEDDTKENSPYRKHLFVPANISKAAFIESLVANESRGIMFETESGALTDALRQDYGNFYDILLRAYHNEPICSLRKGHVRSDIETPYISVLLSGTSEPLMQLFRTISNGLLSRFLFYNVWPDNKFHNVFDNSRNNQLEMSYRHHSEIIADNYARLLSLEKPALFSLKSAQEKTFLRFFQREKELFDYGFVESYGIVHRLALNCHKIMMILTALCKMDEQLLSDRLECDDSTFINAIKLYNIFRDHFILVYQTIKWSASKLIKYDKNEVTKSVMSLQEQGYSLRDIEKILQIPKSSIGRWSKR